MNNIALNTIFMMTEKDNIDDLLKMMYVYLNIIKFTVY